MALVLVRVNVAYPSSCFEELKRNESSLKQAGMLAAESTSSADIPNRIYILFTWDSIPSARNYWGSVAGKNLLKQLHSVEEPEVVILQDSQEL